MAALLAFRVQLHQFVRDQISDQELLDALTFAIAAIVILPLLPNRPVDPFGLLNPFTLWRLVVIAMGLSGAGYAAQRLVGARYGFLVAGLAAGLVSSTAAVVAMGGRSRVQPSLASASAAGAIASLIGSLVYLSAIVATVSPNLIGLLAAPLALAAVFMLIYAAWLVRETPTRRRYRWLRSWRAIDWRFPRSDRRGSGIDDKHQTCRSRFPQRSCRETAPTHFRSRLGPDCF